MHMRIFTPFSLLLANIGGGLASTWAVYSDADCTQSIDTIDGQNGYPDGEAFHSIGDSPDYTCISIYRS